LEPILSLFLETCVACPTIKAARAFSPQYRESLRVSMADAPFEVSPIDFQMDQIVDSMMSPGVSYPMIVTELAESVWSPALVVLAPDDYFVFQASMIPTGSHAWCFLLKGCHCPPSQDLRLIVNNYFGKTWLAGEHQITFEVNFLPPNGLSFHLESCLAGEYEIMTCLPPNTIHFMPLLS
jgi:hypothetical protein